MRFTKDPVETEVERLRGLIDQMDSLLRDASEYIAGLPLVDTPKVAIEIDEFLEDK